MGVRLLELLVFSIIIFIAVIFVLRIMKSPNSENTMKVNDQGKEKWDSHEMSSYKEKYPYTNTQNQNNQQPNNVNSSRQQKPKNEQ